MRQRAEVRKLIIPFGTTKIASLTLPLKLVDIRKIISIWK